MKKIFKLLTILAAAAIAFISCAKEISNNSVSDEELFEVTLVAGQPGTDPVLRTEMNGATPYWTPGDSIGVSNGSSAKSNYKFTTSIVSAATTASFTGSTTVSSELYAYHPYSKNDIGTASGMTGARVDLPAHQNPTATSFDGNADIMVSQAFTVDPASNTVDGLVFGRLGAIVKIVLIDGTSVMSSTQHPSTVSMSAASNLAGWVVIDMVNGKVSAPYYNVSNTVTANYTNETQYAIDGTNGTYLIVAPQTLAEGSTLTISAGTEDYIIEKEITVPSGGINLLPGKVTTLNISLTSSHISAKSASAVYELYTSAITEGDYLIVSNGSAMKATVTSNRFDMTAVTITDNKVYDPGDDLIWHVASNDGYWTIFNEDAAKYAAGNNTNNQGALIASVTDYARWSFVYDSGWTVTNKGNAANTKNSVIRRNGAYGFACYGGSTGTAPTLYKLNDGKSDAEISYARSSDEITEGDDLTPPALSNTHGLAISCNSDNTSVATVDPSTGAISVVGGVGTAIITVSWVEQTISTVTYRAGSTTYTLKINAADANDGSLAKPYTASEAATLALGGNTSSYYIVGYVTNIVYQFDAEHGTSTFWIHDFADGSTQTFEGYHVKYFNNINWKDGNSTIAVGDKVLIYGQLTKYNTTPETNGGYLISKDDKGGLTVPTLSATPNNSNKQIAVTWGAASGAAGSITYTVTCGAQEYVATAAGSHTFTMANYGEYNVKVVATADNVWNSIATTTATLTDPNSSVPPANTVLFSETFDSAADGTSALVYYSSTGTTAAYNSGTYGTLTYTRSNNSNVQVENANSAGGDAKQIMINKNGGNLTISGIKSYGATTVRVSFKYICAKASAPITATCGETDSGNFNSTSADVASFDATISGDTFDLVIRKTSTANSTAARFDDITITVLN